MVVQLGGIDCATQDTKIGVAFGELRNHRLVISKAFVCTKKEKAANTISAWLRSKPRPALLALDAPLGWPQTLSRVLATHRAGEELIAEAHSMFRRETDRFIKQYTGKTPLDVGADRIARTAYAALRLLKEIRTELNIERIPLAWTTPLSQPILAIEVYPAATLIAHKFTSTGYKNPNQVPMRRNIIQQLSSIVTIDEDVEGKLMNSADALDAVVCILAARDFLIGEAMEPENKSLAEVEGWIWCRRCDRA